MTDTFSSGFSSPFGTDQDVGQPTGDVTSTLADLERKLRELERELTSIGRRRVRPEASVAETPAVAVAPPDTGRLVDEQVEFHQPPPPTQRSTPPQPVVAATPAIRTTTAEPAAGSRVEAGTRAEAGTWPEAGTWGEADRERPRPTEAQLASLAELRSFRERLERFTTDLLADYDGVLGRAMSGVAGRVPAEPPSPSPTPTPVPPTPTPAPQTPPAPKQEETIFEGRVELGVGPFYDIGSLSAFEQLVAAVPNVVEVAVRRFEASHAVVDVRLARPVALVGELRRALDTDFSVRQVAPGRIQLAFHDA